MCEGLGLGYANLSRTCPAEPASPCQAQESSPDCARGALLAAVRGHEVLSNLRASKRGFAASLFCLLNGTKKLIYVESSEHQVAISPAENMQFLSGG